MNAPHMVQFGNQHPPLSNTGSDAGVLLSCSGGTVVNGAIVENLVTGTGEVARNLLSDAGVTV